jgi:prepilin-type N-terminal cleavage/methylation domain-containing protein
MRVHESRRGFTLLELVAVIWALSVVLLLGGAALLGANQLQKAASAANDRNALRGIVADQFREDVALAASTPEAVGPLKAGPSCLILHLADQRYVVYRAEAGRLERAALSRADAAPHWVLLGGEGVVGAFRRTGPDQRLLTLTIQEPAGSGLRKRTTEITAALGGDRR